MDGLAEARDVGDKSSASGDAQGTDALVWVGGHAEPVGHVADGIRENVDLALVSVGSGGPGEVLHRIGDGLWVLDQTDDWSRDVGLLAIRGATSAKRIRQQVFGPVRDGRCGCSERARVGVEGRVVAELIGDVGTCGEALEHAHRSVAEVNDERVLEGGEGLGELERVHHDPGPGQCLEHSRRRSGRAASSRGFLDVDAMDGVHELGEVSPGRGGELQSRPLSVSDQCSEAHFSPLRADGVAASGVAKPSPERARTRRSAGRCRTAARR